VFCTVCGAHQGTTEGIGDLRTRWHRYAAHPGEHVASPNLITTLFPHLATHKVHEFRWAFITGVVAVGILYATGVIVGAILVSAILVPTLYLLYLYETQVYRDEPLKILGLTIGLGAVGGLAVTIIADHVFQPVFVRGGYGNVSDEIIATVVIPIIALVVMTAPALLLRGNEAYSETADGLVFGVAAGLGFAATETIVRFSDVIRTFDLRTDPGNWIYPLLSIAIFIPVLHGSAAGAITASVWRGGERPHSGRYAVAGIPVAVGATVAFYVVNQVLADHGVSQAILIGWQALAVGVLLVYIRFLLHHSLLEEAADMGYSAQVCANCHRHMMAAGFCPACGMALSAAPRHLPTVATQPTATPATAEGA
jgi:hypothetical protein